MASSLVLVTGGSSFIGLHAIHQAIQQGYRIRTTIRSDAKKDLILAALKDYDGALDYSQIEFVKADLLEDKGWNEAAEGVLYILHIASPFPAADPKHEDELIKPAREGTLRVLRAAKHSTTCKRVVVTSSAAAIAYGNEPSNGKYYDEKDWTNVKSAGVSAYIKSKTLAEQAGWEYVREGEGKSLELVVVNPVGVFGPPIRPQDESTSCEIVKSMIKGGVPMVPKVSLGIVDVRDVASLHLLVMTRPEADGQRYIANGSSQVRSLLQVSKALREHYGGRASKAPTRELPDWLVRIGSNFSSQLKSVTPFLGKSHGVSNEKSVALGWQPRTPEEAIVATAQRFMDKALC